MPIHEFVCDRCHREKEVLIFWSEDVPGVWCDKCGGTMTKVMSPPAIVYEYKADHAQR